MARLGRHRCTLLGIGLDLLKPVPLAIVLDVCSAASRCRALLAFLGGVSPGAAAGALGARDRGDHDSRTAPPRVAANYLTIDVGQRMVNDLRTELYAHLQKLSLEVPLPAADRRPAVPRDGGHLLDPVHGDERPAAAGERGADARSGCSR